MTTLSSGAQQPALLSWSKLSATNSRYPLRTPNEWRSHHLRTRQSGDRAARAYRQRDETANMLTNAVLVTASGSCGVDGQRLTGPVDSVVRLGQLLDWVCGRGGLMPLGGPGQVWVIGRAACEALGWWTDVEDRRVASHRWCKWSRA